MAKRSAPEVNAGSMADIAFLLLIFFLVTTDIAVDSGLNRKLPPIMEDVEPPIIKQKNIFQVNVNRHDQLFLKSGGEEKVIELKDLRKAAVAFLDNGGGKGEDACKRCKGKKSEKSSDNFQKAIISLANDRLTKYKTYIAVQNEILAAYNEIRNREFLREFPTLGMNYTEANSFYQDKGNTVKERDAMKEKLQVIKDIVPQKFSEAESK